jgi:glycosyltransferase involved in cell wall biosynthesis
MPEKIANPGRVSVVSNVPYLDEFKEFTTNASASSFDWPGFTLVYVGVLNDFRGLDLILEAMSTETVDDEITLAIAGDGPHRECLESKVIDLEIEERVFFEGWIDSEEIPNFLEAGDIGVIPHEVNGFTETTIPNKLFDMMIAGLPVLATDMTPVERVIRNAECGKVVPPSVTTLSEGIVELHSCAYLDRIGCNGRIAVQNQYNWKQESQKVISSVHRVEC